MANKKNVEAAANRASNEKLKNTINPEEIVMDDDDSDMPTPETKTYKRYLKCSDKFMSLINECLGNLPYNYVMVNKEGQRIRLIDFVHFIEGRKDKIEIDEMNNFIGYIAELPLKYARPLMEIIENKDQQGVLWSITEY